MMILLALLLQSTPVGQPIEPMEVKVEQVNRVGDQMTVSYRLTNRGRKAIKVPTSTVVDRAGKELPQGAPKDSAPVAKTKTLAPGVSVGQTVTFNITGESLDRTVYGMNPPTFNPSTWYFVIGKQRIPFSD